MSSQIRQALSSIRQQISEVPFSKRTRPWGEEIAVKLLDCFLSLSLVPRVVDYSKIANGTHAHLYQFPFIDPSDHGRTVSTVRDLLLLRAQIFEGQTLYEHTSRVVSQFVRYASTVDPLPTMSWEAFVTTLILHDIGKSLGSKLDQHSLTLEVVQELYEKRELPFSENEYLTASALIGGDDIASLVQSLVIKVPSFDEKLTLFKAGATAQGIPYDILERFMTGIQYGGVGELDLPRTREKYALLLKNERSKAERLEVDAHAFFKLHLLYFTFDTLAYTSDSTQQGRHGAIALEHLYKVNLDKSRAHLFEPHGVLHGVCFHPSLEEVFQYLLETL